MPAKPELFFGRFNPKKLGQQSIHSVLPSKIKKEKPKKLSELI